LKKGQKSIIVFGKILSISLPANLGIIWISSASTGDVQWIDELDSNRLLLLLTVLSDFILKELTNIHENLISRFILSLILQLDITKTIHWGRNKSRKLILKLRE